MTRIYTSSITLPTSGQLKNSPLPQFQWQQPMPYQDAPPIGLSDDETEGYVALGQDSMMPYLEQTGYDRTLKNVDHPTIIIENDHLCATLLPLLGGRLYSLWDKTSKRELLFSNPVLQYANLSLRNAWFSGGIEWNGGSLPGHTPSTCDPIFAHLVDTDLGPILRLHDFDRITETAWQVDLYLPDDAPTLFVNGRIVNPNNYQRDVYWWTNATVPAKPGLRIISPADHVIEHVLPDNHLEPFTFPDHWGFDGSYPENWANATSVFFRKPAQNTPWMAARLLDGSGLAQISTNTLRGRKYFYFGTGSGGQHWMEFLSKPDYGNYVEIQSGLMPTQNQRFALAPKSSIHWTECFFPLAKSQDSLPQNYEHAVESSAAAIAAVVSSARLEKIDMFMRKVAQQQPGKILAKGYDWGAVYEKMTGAQISPGMCFGQASADRTPWHTLVNTGQIPATSGIPETFVTSQTWRTLLERSAENYGTNWLTELALGIVHLNLQNLVKARTHLNESINQNPSWLAHRCLAVLDARECNADRAIASYHRALNCKGAPGELILEFANHLRARNLFDQASDLLDNAPDELLESERYRILLAELALGNQDFAKLEELLSYNFATIREGENILAELWKGLVLGQAEQLYGRPLTIDEIIAELSARPIPYALNFGLMS